MVLAVQVLGEYMIFGYLDPYGSSIFPRRNSYEMRNPWCYAVGGFSSQAISLC